MPIRRSVLYFLFVSLMALSSHATTVYECAPNKVRNNSVLVNILQKKDKLVAEIKMGATKKKLAQVPVIETKEGFVSAAKNKKFDLNIGLKRSRNLNIDGYQSSMKAQIPGHGKLSTSFVCGDRVLKNLVNQ